MQKKWPPWMAASAPAPPVSLPYGFQTYVASTNNQIGQFLAINLLVCISYWFCFTYFMQHCPAHDITQHSWLLPLVTSKMTVIVIDKMTLPLHAHTFPSDPLQTAQRQQAESPPEVWKGLEVRKLDVTMIPCGVV